MKKPQKGRRLFSLYVFFSFITSLLFPVLYKRSLLSPVFFNILLFLLFHCGSVTDISFLFLFPCSVSKWQWQESTVACHCHVNQIRCHNRKWVQMRGRSTVTHTHDLLPLQAKRRPSRHRYADTNLLWVKGNCTLRQNGVIFVASDLTGHPVSRAFPSDFWLHVGNYRLSVMIPRKFCSFVLICCLFKIVFVAEKF